VHHATVETERGPVSFATDGDRVCSVRLGARADARGPGTALDREVARQLTEYFGGRRTSFDLPLRVDALPFTAAVLAAVEAIPFGETLTYGDVALAVGRPLAARAVGQAVGANPLPILIPCHRVLAAGQRIGGFGAGLPWKRFLLGLESSRGRPKGPT
jgi:methylated-DNA-[protein]-cysteine S-methyltransferase